jgi:hypothetical protein
MATHDTYAHVTGRSRAASRVETPSLRSMVATIVVVGLLTAPLLMYVAAHARLTHWEYELTRLKHLENQEQERASRLRVSLAEATASGRIRAGAEELGLEQYSATDIVRVSAEVKPAAEAPVPEPELGLGERLGSAWTDAKVWAGLEEVGADGD